MKVMLDLNVLLDVAQRREPFYAASAAVLSQAVEGSTVACLPGHALTTLHYIVAKNAGQEPAGVLVDWVLAHLEIVPQDRVQFIRARSLRFNDFEDAALASAAEAAGCDLIVTRNVADFISSPVPSVTPEESPPRPLKEQGARRGPRQRGRRAVVFLDEGCSQRQPVRGVERRHLVALGERGIVEDGVEEVVEAAAEAEHRLADVDQLGGAGADDVHAEQAPVSRWKSILKKPLSSPRIWPRAISR